LTGGNGVMLNALIGSALSWWLGVLVVGGIIVALGRGSRHRTLEDVPE
jgi:hypothetical protein